MTTETVNSDPQGLGKASAEAPATSASQAPAPAPADGHTVAPTLSAEAMAKLRDQQAQQAQQALLRLRQDKEDACAKEIQAVLAKHGCELIIGHQVKISLAAASGNKTI